MGNSAIEALIIGVNVFIFMIALTIAIFLMNAVMDMSNKANEIIKSETGSMIQTENDKERIITGSELIYYNTDDNVNNRYKLYVYDVSNDETKTLAVYLDLVEESLQSLIEKEYVMTYGGIETEYGIDKVKYVFKEI